MFVQGYTGAEDRLFLMDVLRHYGRARISEFLGASPSDVEMDREQLAIAPYEEADLTAQVQAFANGDAENQAIYADATAYVDGVIGYQHSCKCPERAEGVDPFAASASAATARRSIVPRSMTRRRVGQGSLRGAAPRAVRKATRHRRVICAGRLKPGDRRGNP